MNLNYWMNFKLWVYGLLQSVISAAAGAVAVVIVDPTHFNFSSGIKSVGAVAAATGLIALANYLTKHPLPKWDGVERRDDSTKGQ